VKILPIAFLLYTFAGVTSFADDTNTLPAKITVDGVTYEDVRWGTATPSAVTIFHKTGIASVPLAKLPPDLQKQLGYDSAKAEAFITEERKLAAHQAERERKRKELEEKAKNASTVSSRVLQVLADGLLVETYDPYDYVGASPVGWRGPFFVTGVPNFRRYVEQGGGRWLLCPDGVFSYTDVQGGQRQVAKFQYCGTWDLDKEWQRKNRVYDISPPPIRKPSLPE